MAKKESFYTLANPLCVILNKSNHDFQRSDFLDVIEKKELERDKI